MARVSLREAHYETHRRLAQRILEETRERDPAKAAEQWRKLQAVEADHALAIINDIRTQHATGADFAALSVGLQAIRRLAFK